MSKETYSIFGKTFVFDNVEEMKKYCQKNEVFLGNLYMCEVKAQMIYCANEKDELVLIQKDFIPEKVDLKEF